MPLQKVIIRTRTSLLRPREHPWQAGEHFSSPGGHFTYRVIGPCCRLFDREQLPWPCCRLQWRGKEPSWRRIGRQFIVDIATQNYPSYCVEILGQSNLDQSNLGKTVVITLYTTKLPSLTQNWWYFNKLPGPDAGGTTPALAVQRH